MKLINTIFLFLLFSQIASAQVTKDVLFVGSELTFWNILPNILKQAALSTGDTLNFVNDSPTDATFASHSTNPTTLNNISNNQWDFVVLQADGQLPAFPLKEVQTDVFPFAKTLCDSIRSSNSCSVPLFFMTWGFQDGDIENCYVHPPVCTYAGMDDLLKDRYVTMGTDNNAMTSPVGEVWRYIRTNHPTVELYSPDGTLPSFAGSYAAACALYAFIFDKDPADITYNFAVDSATASIIRNAAHNIAFNLKPFYDWTDLEPDAGFSYNAINLPGNELVFESSAESDSYFWNFGNGTTSTLQNPDTVVYDIQYDSDSTYTVKLIVDKCGVLDSSEVDIVVPVYVSIDDNINIDLQLIYDNASKTLKISKTEDIAYFKSLNIYNISGSLIFNNNNIDINSSISLNNLKEQIYIIQLRDDSNRIFTKKLSLF